MDNNNTVNRNEEEIEVSLYDIVAAVFRKKFMIAAIIIVAVALAVVYLQVADPVYESKATVMVSSLSSESLNLSSLMSGFTGGSSTEIATEVALLTSRTTVQSALDSLDLGRYVNPDGIPYDQLEEPIEAQDLIEGNAITVTNITDTNIVEISVRNTSAQFAADLANALVEAFNNVLTSYARTGSSASIDFVSSQIPVAQENFSMASRALADYQRQNNVLQTSQESQVSLLRYNYLLSRRAPLELEAQEAVAICEAAAFAPSYETLCNLDSVRILEAEISAAQREILSYDMLGVSNASASSSLALTANQSNRYYTLTNRLESARNDLQNVIIASLEGVSLQDANMFASAFVQRLVSESEMALLDEMLEAEDATLESVPELEMELARLQSDVQVYQAMVVSLMQMEQEAQLRDAAISDNVSLVDAAVVEEDPVSPNKLIVLAVAFVLGAFIGVGIALLLELSDRSIFTAEDLKEALPANVPFLGWVPMLKAPKKDRYASSVVYSRPNTFESERYKLIASNIIFGRKEKQRVITVCSTDKNEGKTSVMANIALSLTQNGYRVLLADGDLRMPSCEQYFHLEHQERGLVDVVMEGENLDSCIIQPLADVDSLHLLPCGTRPSIPSMVFSADSFVTLIDDLKKRYDIILFDAPPLAYASELLALTKLAPEVIIVTRAGITDKTVLADMIESFNGIGATVIGACLNAVIANYGAKRGSGNYSYSYASKDPQAMASVIKKVPFFSSRKMYYRKRYKRDEKFRERKVSGRKNRPTHPYKPELDVL